MAVGQLVALAKTTTTNVANTVAATVPNDGSVIVGDLLIWTAGLASGSRTFTVSGVSNYSFAGSASQSGSGIHLWYKICEAADLGATITLTPSTGATTMAMMLGKVSGADTTNPFDSPVKIASNTSAAATTKTTPTVTSVAAGSREISIAFDTRGASAQTTSWSAPSGETQRDTAFAPSPDNNPRVSMTWGDSDLEVSGSVGGRVWTADTTTIGASWTLAVKAGVTNINGTDTGSGTDSESIAAASSDSDTGAGSDTESVTANTPDVDTGSGTETAFISLSDGDTTAGADTESIAATNSDSETGTGSEIATISVSDSDTGSGTDSETTTQGATDSDTNSGSDTESTAATLTDSDTGTGTEANSIAATLTDSDTAIGTEAYDLVVSISDSDTANSTESATAGVGTSTTPVDFEGGSSGESWSIQIFGAPVAERSLVLGPADLYIAPFGAVEPSNGLVGSAPDSGVWTSLGGLLGGVGLSVDQEWEEIRPKQVGYTVTRRMKKRLLSIKTQLAEHTLTNLAYALNDLDSKSSGSGWEAYTPAEQQEGTVLPYVAVIVDGWAPGSNAGGRHKRRRLVVRKCLSIDNVEFAYSKDNQSVYTVTWSCHYVDSATPIFRVVDEA